jgi:nucleoside-diphosphate-sugar epimerase
VQTALILGGTGQIGRATARRLIERGWEVTLAARSLPDPPIPDARFVAVDRLELGALSRALGDGVDVLIDVIPLQLQDADQLIAGAGQVGSVIAVSTAGVYVDDAGRAFNDPEARFPVPISERQMTVAPDTDDYHATKRAIELTLLEDNRLSATIIRPCAIHGPYGKHLREWYFVRRALDGRRAVVLAHQGAGRFHTTSVDNLAELIRLAAMRPGSRVVNCGDPTPPSALEIARIVADALEIEWAEVLLPGAEQDTVGDHPWNIPHPFVLDMTTAEIDLGYRAPTGYANAVERTLQWLIDHPYPADEMAAVFNYDAEDDFIHRLTGKT